MKQTIRILSAAIFFIGVLHACSKSSGGGPTPTVAGTVTTIAGDGIAGFIDGVDSVAEFNQPVGVATDAQGNVYVNDNKNNRVRKITPDGMVSTFAGNGTAGYKDSSASNAEFNGPNEGIAVDAQGNVYVSDPGNGRIRKITPTGNVTTLAGNGKYGFADGAALSAEFRTTAGLAVDGQGNVYAADCYNNSIRKITQAGVVSTLAGGTQGYLDATGTSAEFWLPRGIAVDAQGNVYVVDCVNEFIRKITPAGVVSTFAGNGQSGLVDGPAANAEFYLPDGLAIDTQGNLYVGDESNNVIRKITPAGVVSTTGGNGIAGFVNGVGKNAEFNEPWGVAVDAHGNVYVCDLGNNRVRKISAQ